MKELFIILVVLSLLFLGCVGEKTTEEMKSSTTLPGLDADYALEDADIPLMDENETVEIGEMI